MKNTTIKWPCPAKVNLFLNITGQRKDGYHTLQSVFQLLDYGDTLLVSPNDSGIISFNCNILSLSGHDNLVMRAVKKLQQIAQNRSIPSLPGVELFLDKKLPAGSGLGGGSSNCATTLIALNYQWNLGLSTSELMSVGLTLGADVPVFVKGCSAFVEGIGEVITPYYLPKTWYLVIYPQTHVSTKKIFSHPMLTRNCKTMTIRDLNVEKLLYEGRNCMQSVVCHEYPEVKAALSWLRSHCKNARMSGSGSCLFSIFDNEKKMRRIASLCRWPHFVAKGVNQSALISKLNRQK